MANTTSNNWSDKLAKIRADRGPRTAEQIVADTIAENVAREEWLANQPPTVEERIADLEKATIIPNDKDSGEDSSEEFMDLGAAIRNLQKRVSVLERQIIKDESDLGERPIVVGGK